MTPEGLNFQTLLRDLPELLDGSEPVLSRPHVREYVLRDPDAQAAIVAASEMVNALTIGSDLVRALPKATVRSMERPIRTAKKYFARELAELFHEVGSRMLLPTLGATYLYGTSKLSSASDGSLESAVARLARRAGVVLPTVAIRGATRTAAQRLFEAAVEVGGATAIGARYSAILAADLLPAVAIARYKLLARDVPDSRLVGSIVNEIGLLLLKGGDPVAHEWLSLGMKLYPRAPSISYNFFLSTCVMGGQGDCVRALDSLQSTADPAWVMNTVASADAEDRAWLRAAIHRGALTEDLLMSGECGPLGQALLEVLR